MGAEFAAKECLGREVKQQGLPVTIESKHTPQQQHTTCNRCCYPAGVERIYSSPEAWRRPNDTVWLYQNVHAILACSSSAQMQ
jgi:hypothetical protein